MYKPPQQYSVNTLAQHVREAFMLTGEQIITLHTYTVVEDEGVRPRCPHYDDVYAQDNKFVCSLCYGTTFEGGIKATYRCWAVFEDNVAAVDQSKRGQWNPEDKLVQLESYPTIQQSDFLARVITWNLNNTPARLGDIYTIGKVKEETVRAGARYFADSYSEIDDTGRNYKVPSYDRVGQSTQATLVSPDHPIYNYPLIGQRIDRYDSLPRG